MSRRIIPVLCALAVAVVPATALAQPAQDPSPVVTRGGVVYGDTKYDLQNQSDQKSPTGSAYDQARQEAPAGLGVRRGHRGRQEGHPAAGDRAPGPARRDARQADDARLDA